MSAATEDTVSAESHPVEIARYEVEAGERVIVGRRICDGVEISDHPASGRGAHYLVDSGIRSTGELAALLRDYRRQAASLDACPMSRKAIVSMLRNTDSSEVLVDVLGAA